MPSKSEASQDFNDALKSVEVLVAFAKSEDEKGHGDNRILFLKLSVVLMVTRFQVFVENIIEEFRYSLTNSNTEFNELPTHMRLNSLKIISDNFKISKKLENKESYDDDKKNLIEDNVRTLLAHFEAKKLDDYFKINNKYPLGKTGKSELIELMRQIEGKNIFDNGRVDINVIDSILLTRHLIIHQDRDNGLTEEKIIEYKNYLIDLGQFIDEYLFDCLDRYRK